MCLNSTFHFLCWLACVCVRTPNFSVCVWECAGFQMICLSFFFLYSDFTWILRRKKIAWQSSRNSGAHMCVPIEDDIFRKNMTLHVSGAQLTVLLCPTVRMKPWGWDKHTHVAWKKRLELRVIICVCVSSREFICKGGQKAFFFPSSNSSGVWPPLYVWRNDWTDGGRRINESACSSFPRCLVCLLRMEHLSQRRGGC